MATPSPAERQYQLEHMDEQRSTELLVIAIICSTLIVVSLIARLASRSISKVGFKADDYTMIVACLLGLGSCTVLIPGSYAGIGKHVWAIPPEQFSTISKHLYAYGCAFFAAYPLVKISILLLYRRILPNQRLKLIIRVFITFLVLFMLATCLSILMACIPIQGLWDFLTVDAKCIDGNMLATVQASINAATDVLILVLPIPLVWKLKIPPRQKAGVLFLFGLGSLTCFTSIIRIYCNVHNHHSTDFTYTIVDECCASISDVCLAILCGNLPTVRPLARALAPRALADKYFKRSSQRSHATSQNGSKNRTVASKKTIPVSNPLSTTATPVPDLPTYHSFGTAYHSRPEGHDYEEEEKEKGGQLNGSDTDIEAQRGIEHHSNSQLR